MKTPGLESLFNKVFSRAPRWLLLSLLLLINVSSFNFSLAALPLLTYSTVTFFV